jgi:prepilin-type N-terminal cleavage/methylation domain-containing protein
MPSQNSRSFTLIELLIVLAIIAILATVLILTIKPGAIFSRARDTKRIGDLKNIEKIMDVLSTEQTFNELNYASPNVVYISLPDSSSTCGSWLSQLPSLPSGWSYHCSATPTNIDGTGWIPIPFSNFPILNISQLFIDPINKPPYYYSFVVGGSYEVTAYLESDSNRNINGPAGTDGGTSWNVYEAGTDKKLTPLVVEDGGGRDKSLVGYWSFDEGSGTTARDLSGYGNNGTLIGTIGWTTGKVGYALQFGTGNNYGTGYVNIGNVLNFGTRSFSISAWVNPYGFEPTYGWQRIVTKRDSGSYWYSLTLNSTSRIPMIEFSGGVGSGVALSAMSWYHLVATRDGATGVAKIYINGTLANSGSGWGQNLDNTGPLQIGAWIGGQIWSGLIDEVRIYNRALSDSEIKSLYESTK